MIIKNLTRHAGSSTGSLVRYLFKYVLNPEKQLKNITLKHKEFVLRHNIKGNTIAEYIRDFKENEKRRIFKCRNQIAIHHTILSWSNKDSHHITNKTLRAIAKEYIKQRGELNLYLITRHSDREHIHLHVAMSGTRLDGRSSRISQQEFAALKQNMNLFQRNNFPELEHSLPQHGKGKNDKRNPSKLEWFHSRKEELITIMQKLHKDSASFEEFLRNLSAQGFQPYYRGQEQRLAGIISEDGKKYRLSSLGVDTGKLLDENFLKDQEEKELSIIRSLRERSIQERDDERDFEREEQSTRQTNSDDFFEITSELKRV